MSIDRVPYARQNRNLLLPFERASASSPRIDRSYRNRSNPQAKPLLRGQRRAEIAILAAMCLLIGIISAYDAYMLVRFQETIHEQNPMGRWLMDVDNGSVALFVGCKFAGTILVLASLVFLYIYRQSMALCVAATLSLGQIALFCYVTYF